MHRQNHLFLKISHIRVAFILFTLSILMFTSGSILSENIKLKDGPDGMNVHLVNTTGTSTTLEFELNSFSKEFININGESYAFLTAPNMIWTMEKGYPQLPIFRRSIIIPDLEAMNFRILDAEYTEISTETIVPSKGHFTRDIDPSTVPFTFNEFYQSGGTYPQENVMLDDPYIVRDFRGQTVQVNPIQYNPSKGILRIATRLVVEIFADDNLTAKNPFVRSNPFKRIRQDFEGIYKTLFINYGESNYKYDPIPEPGRLLILYHENYATQITPFYDWKVNKGMDVVLTEYPSGTGSGSTAIKDYIQSLYDAPEGLTYIILVGESNEIPTLYGNYEGAPSDPCYVKLAGSDAYPDAYISRISVTSGDNCEYVLDKIKRYETDRYPGGDGDWYFKGTGVASNEGSPPDWQRANLLRDMLIDNMNFSVVDEIYDPGATDAQVTNALNEGRSVLNYIGHGSGTSWSTTYFNNSDIHNLSNGYKNPFIFDVACMNGDFTMSECMEEAWIRAGDMANPKGAVAVYGSSTNASWVPPCDMQNHGIELLTTYERETVGGVCFNGLMYAMDLWGGSSGEGLKLMEQYNIFGDCSTVMTLGVIPDSVPPQAIDDLSASAPTSTSVTLNWTAPQDTSQGGVVQYTISYSTSEILNDTDFDNGTKITISGCSDTEGTPRTHTVEGLDFNTTYYFAVKCCDCFNNTSDLSNGASQATLYAPEISVDPTSITKSIAQNYIFVENVEISNVSANPSTLDYSFQIQNSTFPENSVSLDNTEGTILSGNSEILAIEFDSNLMSQTTYTMDLVCENNDPSKTNLVIPVSITVVTGIQSINFGAGYTWFSININPGTMHINGLFPGESMNFELNDRIIGQTSFAIWEGRKWIGSLEVLDPAQMYIMNVTNPQQRQLLGQPISPSDHPVNLGAGFTWVGYLPQSTYDINEALAGFSPAPTNNDRVMSQTQFAVYDESSHNWVGSLTDMEPGTGYKIEAAQNSVFTYPGTKKSLAKGSGDNQTNSLTAAPNWEPMQNQQFNMNVIGQLTFDGQTSTDPNDIIGAFVGDECRGVANPAGSGLVFLTITSNQSTGETITFKAYDSDSDIIDENIPESIPFENQALVGSVASPFIFNGALPVELTSFTGTLQNETVLLQWETATELNNYGFEIQRKITSDKSPDEEWLKIGFVEGAGNSNLPNIYSFKDTPAFNADPEQHVYKYRLKQTDFDGTSVFSDEIEVEILPNEYKLYQNYPNPFNPATIIRYTLPQKSIVKVIIYNSLGEEVEHIVNGVEEAGYYEVEWNSNGLSSGMYIYSFEAKSMTDGSSHSSIKKMILLK